MVGTSGRALGAVLVITLVAGCGGTAAGPAADVTDTSSPATSTATSTATSPSESAAAGPESDESDPVVPEGFATGGFRVLPPVGEPCDLCLWVAQTDDDRRRGLMGVDDLGGRDGMAFVYESPRTTAFTMRNTLLDLSIAFFDADGEFLGAFDMEPCVDEPCQRYPTPPDFTVAVEVRRGDLERFGIGPGSRLVAHDGACE